MSKHLVFLFLVVLFVAVQNSRAVPQGGNKPTDSEPQKNSTEPIKEPSKNATEPIKEPSKNATEPLKESGPLEIIENFLVKKLDKLSAGLKEIEDELELETKEIAEAVQKAAKDIFK